MSDHLSFVKKIQHIVPLSDAEDELNKSQMTTCGGRTDPRIPEEQRESGRVYQTSNSDTVTLNSWTILY